MNGDEAPTLFERVEPGLQPGVRIGRLGFVRARRHRGIVPDHRPLQRVTHARFIERFGQVGEDAGAQACRGGHRGDAVARMIAA